MEPIRPGEDEAATALRLRGRRRRRPGPRFFDAVTVAAWYAEGPFVKAVPRLGWAGVSGLKQERYEIDSSGHGSDPRSVTPATKVGGSNP